MSSCAAFWTCALCCASLWLGMSWLPWECSDSMFVIRMLEAAALLPTVHLQSLSELERFRLQEIALYALQQRGLCTDIKPGERSLCVMHGCHVGQCSLLCACVWASWMTR